MAHAQHADDAALTAIRERVDAFPEDEISVGHKSNTSTYYSHAEVTIHVDKRWNTSIGDSLEEAHKHTQQVCREDIERIKAFVANAPADIRTLLDTVAALERQLADAQARERAAELLHSLEVAYRFFMTDLSDDEVISIGKWTTPVPGWHSQFDAKLKLTVGDFRKAFAAADTQADAEG